MQSNSAPYTQLRRLALEWAVDAQVPPEMVLRNICEWAAAGAFPEKSLVDSIGKKISALNIYMSFRAAIEPNGLLTGISVGDTTYHEHGSEWGPPVIAAALVSSEGVLAFCEHTNTLPPPSMLGGIRRAWAKLKQQKSVSPPPCPDAEDHAVKGVRTPAC